MTKNYFLSLSLITLAVLGTATAQPLIPGQSYFNSNNYAEYIYGTLPVIISVPHDGTLRPSTIPDRTDIACGGDATTVRDINTMDVARALDLALTNLMGAHPHTVINRLHRIKLDMNREQAEAACGSAIGEQTWLDYHEFVDSARQRSIRKYGRALFIDIHGHGHTIQRNEIGYLLTGTTLRQSDTYLNTPGIINVSSIKYLTSNNLSGQGHAQLIRGPKAFGTLLATAGYPSVPSQQDPAPASGDDYFNGGYNTARWGSRDSGVVDAFQIETNYTGVRDNQTNINAFAAAVAQAIKTYLGEMIDPTTQLSGTPFTAGNLLVGRFATTPTTIQKIALAEINPANGAVVKNVDLPSSGTQSIGLTNILTDGQLTLSENGNYVTLAGYALEDGSASSITASATGRAVARLDVATNYQSYVLPNSSEGFGTKDPYNASNIRSAFTTDGNSFYVTGGATGSTTATAGGIWYFTAGNQSNAVQIIPTPNTRYVLPYNGQLYAAAQNITGTTTLPQGFYKIGNGMPTGTADSTRLFTPNATTVIGFTFSPDGSVCYVCINGSTTHVEKWRKTGSTWAFLYNVRPSGVATAPRGMAAKFNSGTADIYLTYGTQIVKVSDVVANATAPATDPAATVIYTETASGIGLRGLSLTPSSVVILPLQLVAFSGAFTGAAVQLQWQLGSASEAGTLIVERSKDAKEFKAVGQAGSEATRFTDIDYLKGASYYRLKMIDKDGRITYSKNILINAAAAVSASIYPNPAHDFVTVDHGAAGKNATITIVSADGKVLQLMNVVEAAIRTTVEVSRLPRGFYTVQYRSANRTVHFKLVK